MPWIKVDDHYDEHHKFADAGPLGVTLWLAGMAYCNRNLTDGLIPWAVARNLVSWEWLGEPEGSKRPVIRTAYSYLDDRGEVDYEDITSQFVIDILVRVGLWTDEGYGYRVHDYSKYQPTKAQVEAERAAKVAAGQAGGRASAQARGQAGSQQRPSNRSSEKQAESNPVPVPVPVPLDSAPTDVGAESARERLVMTGDVDEELLSWMQREHRVTVRPGNGWHLRIIDWFRQGVALAAAKDAVTSAVDAGGRLDRQVIPAAEDILFPRREPERLAPREQRRREIEDAAARIRAEAQAARGAGA